MHFEAGFAAFSGDSPWVVWNDEPGASYRWMGWPEAVLADAWGGLCGEETGCGKRALRVGWRVQCGACVIAACCIGHRSAVYEPSQRTAFSVTLPVGVMSGRVGCARERAAVAAPARRLASASLSEGFYLCRVVPIDILQHQAAILALVVQHSGHAAYFSLFAFSVLWCPLLRCPAASAFCSAPQVCRVSQKGHCAAYANAPQCDDRCSVLRWSVHCGALGIPL